MGRGWEEAPRPPVWAGAEKQKGVQSGNKVARWGRQYAGGFIREFAAPTAPGPPRYEIRVCSGKGWVVHGLLLIYDD